MKVIIMCGGKGTRLREETVIKPKPMVEIGGRPVLWHIMNIYARFGFKDFILPLGYKGEYIKQYFHDYNIRNTDFTVDLRSGAVTPHPREIEDWRVTLCDTGQETLKGGRLKRVARYIDTDRFMVTYGDGVADIDINKLIDFHMKSGTIGTFTGVRMPRASAPCAPTGTAISCPGKRSPCSTSTSTAASSSSSASSWTIWTKTNPATWKKSPCSAWPPKASFPCTATPVSGSAWIPSAKKVCWKKCGRLAVRPGKCGTNNELGILPRQTRVCNRAYRF